MAARQSVGGSCTGQRVLACIHVPSALPTWRQKLHMGTVCAATSAVHCAVFESRRPSAHPGTHLCAVCQAAPVGAVHHPHQAVSLLKVVAPVRAQRLLAPHIPHIQLIAAAGQGMRGTHNGTGGQSSSGVGCAGATAAAASQLKNAAAGGARRQAHVSRCAPTLQTPAS